MNQSGIFLNSSGSYSQWRAALGECYPDVMVGDLGNAEAIWDAGALPFIHLMFKKPTAPNATIQNIAAGMFDAQLDAWLRTLKAYCDAGRKAVVVYLPEFNGNWCVYANDNWSTNDFKKAYRNFVAMGRAMGLDETMVKFCWAPNDTGWGSLKDWWPDDGASTSTVDILGSSAYNWGGIFPNEPWESPDFLFDRYTNEVRRFTSKPIVFTQTGSGLNDTRTPKWLSDAVAYTNRTGTPFIWFNFSEFTYGPGLQDWNIRTATLDDTRPDDWFIEETEMDPTRNMYYPKEGDSGYAVEYWQVRIIEAANNIEFYGNSNRAFVEAESDLTFKIWDEKTTALLSSFTGRNSYGVGPTEAIMIEDATLGA